MGRSVAPVFANIYAASFEQDVDMWYRKGLLSFVRYISDIKFIFEGTREQLQEFIDFRTYGKLKITWEIRSAWQETPFVDATFFFCEKPGVTEIQTRLFRKKMNKHQYIPWSSAYPESVKRSFVKAELTQFMIVSSQRFYFEESKETFFMNLRRRGYPADKLVEFGRQVTYADRFLVLTNTQQRSSERDIPLLIPSKYNGVWNMLKLRPVFEMLTSVWSANGVEIPNTLRGPIVKSLRRSENLFDKISAWNRSTLNTFKSRDSKKRTFEDAFRLQGGRKRIEALRPRPTP
jgi:hypothetical protein